MAAIDWTERKRMLVTIGVGVVINLVVGYFLYSANATYDELKGKLKGKLAEIKTLKVTTERKLPLQSELTRRKRELQRAEKQLPELSEVEKMIQDTAKIAEQSGAELLDSTASTPTVENGLGGSYEKTVYRTRWKADFKALCMLLNLLEEHSDRFVAFENLVLIPANQGLVPMGSRHEISVDLVVYRYVRAQP